MHIANVTDQSTTGQPATQTTEAKITGAPSTLAEALQRIAELEDENTYLRKEDKEDRAFRAARAVVDSATESALEQLAQTVADTIIEIAEDSPVGYRNLCDLARDTQPQAYSSEPIFEAGGFLAEFEEDLKKQAADLVTIWAEEAKAKAAKEAA
jgi:hypothetical protein